MEKHLDNRTYLTMTGGVTKEDVIQRCLQAMEKYHNNKWWEPGVDLRTYAYYQFHEAIQLRASISDLKKGLSEIVNRPVYTYELIDEEFKQEVERAWKWGVGATTDDERQERFEAGIQHLKAAHPHLKIIEEE
jgi:hypothetical protein